MKTIKEGYPAFSQCFSSCTDSLSILDLCSLFCNHPPIELDCIIAASASFWRAFACELGQGKEHPWLIFHPLPQIYED